MVGAPTVLVVGEALIDIVETSEGATEHVGGSPANVALGLGRRGVDAALVTQLGDDERGRRIAEHLEASGARVIARSIPRTSTALARVRDDGSAEYRFDITWDEMVGEVPRHDVIHTGSIGAFLAPGAASVLDMIRQSGAEEVTFDPNIRAELLGRRDDVLTQFRAIAERATVVKLSDEDAEWLFPGRGEDDVSAEILALGPRLVAITRGADGAVLRTASDRVAVDPVVVDAVDTIGAGDTFMASLIASVAASGSGLLTRERLTEIGADAVRSAAITVSRAGADLPWAAELLA